MFSSSVYIPREEELLSTLTAFRQEATYDARKPPNAKAIMRHFESVHPNWKIPHSRLVKVLKVEKEQIALRSSSACPSKYIGDNDENFNSLERSDSSTSIGFLLSPKSKSAAQALDSPVSKKNILPTRLRPASVLSMVYGNVVRKEGKPSTPLKEKEERLASELIEEAEDPTYVPPADASPAPSASSSSPFSRDVRSSVTTTIRASAAAAAPSAAKVAPPAAAKRMFKIPNFSPIKFGGKDASPYKVMTPTPSAPEPLALASTTSASAVEEEVASAIDFKGEENEAHTVLEVSEPTPVEAPAIFEGETANPMSKIEEVAVASTVDATAALYEPEKQEEREQVSCYARCSIM